MVGLHFYVRDNKNTKSEIQQYTTDYQATMDSDEVDSDIISFRNPPRYTSIDYMEKIYNI